MQVQGKVVRLESYGAFIDIGAERPGLVHVSEMSNDYVSDPKEIVKVGEEVDVSVIEINRKKKQIRLSMKVSLEDLALDDDEEDLEELPTAMELALRSAMEGKEAGETAKDDKEASKKGRESQEELLARTLEQRVRTS